MRLAAGVAEQDPLLPGRGSSTWCSTAVTPKGSARSPLDGLKRRRLTTVKVSLVGNRTITRLVQIIVRPPFEDLLPTMRRLPSPAGVAVDERGKRADVDAAEAGSVVPAGHSSEAAVAAAGHVVEQRRVGNAVLVEPRAR